MVFLVVICRCLLFFFCVLIGKVYWFCRLWCWWYICCWGIWWDNGWIFWVFEWSWSCCMVLLFVCRICFLFWNGWSLYMDIVMLGFLFCLGFFGWCRYLLVFLFFVGRFCGCCCSCLVFFCSKFLFVSSCFVGSWCCLGSVMYFLLVVNLGSCGLVGWSSVVFCWGFLFGSMIFLL